MGLTNSLEPRFRWLSFPGLIRGIIILHFFTFFMLALRPEEQRPELIALLSFDLPKIQAGEVWRLISFILIPPIQPGLPANYLFIIFILLIGFRMGDALEHAWGVFRTSIYCYGLIVCQIIANVMLGLIPGSPQVAWGGILFYEALFFAFATLFPKFEFRIMFLFPVPIYILALLNALGGALLIFAAGSTAPLVATYLGICFFPYLYWGVPVLLGHLRNRAKTQKRQLEFRAKTLPTREAFHTCESCGATEHTHPHLEFRIASDDRELCTTCLDEGD